MTITEAIMGLNFQSESDSPWYLTIKAMRRPNPVTAAIVLSVMKLDPASEISELDLDEWFDHVIATQPQSERYEELKTACLAELDQPKVFKILGNVADTFNVTYVIAGGCASGTECVFTYAAET